MVSEPSYLRLYQTGELAKRVEALYRILENCELCPRKCHVNRLKGEIGVCRMGSDLTISNYGPHFGEEKVLVGFYGSGTIFVTGCNLLCVYCQNYEISHLRSGSSISEETAAKFMIQLQRKGCHNINLVTPTHYAPQLVKAIETGVEKGLRLPIVWNCSGYENFEIIELLENIVDIYMPDIKYGSSGPAKKYSNAPDYFDRCKESVIEMHRQVGDLKLDEHKIAYRGLIIRHLVLPGNLGGSEEVLGFIRDLSENTYLNIMDQYRPEGKAWEYPELRRPIKRKELCMVLQTAKKLKLHGLDKIY